jgi:hypothetical protein
MRHHIYVHKETQTIKDPRSPGTSGVAIACGMMGEKPPTRGKSSMGEKN